MNALPSPKPNCRKRLALRFAVLVVAVSALGAAYWFTWPPELVWWTSGKIFNSGHSVRALIPFGGEMKATSIDTSRRWHRNYSIRPVERRPRLLRWLFRYKPEGGSLEIYVHKDDVRQTPLLDEIVREDGGPVQGAYRQVVSKDQWIAASIGYDRTDLPAFNRTYRQICNSLRIE